MTPERFTYGLTVAYDGSAYHGWQRQPGVATVAGRLEEALARLSGQAVTVSAAGRTDAGAHALGQVARVQLDGFWDPAALRAACNRQLPADVRVLEAVRASDSFDPRRDAWRRTYRYLVRTAARPQPVGRMYWWEQPRPLELAPMRSAAGRLLGRHDFAAFGSSPAPGGSTVRTLDRSEVTETRDGVRFEFRADAFLRGMVRSLAGCLVAVGAGRLTGAVLQQWLEGPRPRAASPWAAPARGLHLWQVEYRWPVQKGVAA